MDTISGMNQSKRVAGRYYVSMESGERLIVNLDIIARYSLYTGRNLDSDEMEALRRDSGKTEAKARALRIIGSRNMSRKKLEERLTSLGETEETARETAEWMERIGAVNDTEYAAMIVRHYAEKGYGLGKIRDELYRRGIDKELWEEAIAQMPDSSDALDSFIITRLHGRRPDDRELKRLTDALRRRGFSWPEIKEALLRCGPDSEGFYE